MSHPRQWPTVCLYPAGKASCCAQGLSDSGCTNWQVLRAEKNPFPWECWPCMAGYPFHVHCSTGCRWEDVTCPGQEGNGTMECSSVVKWVWGETWFTFEVSALESLGSQKCITPMWQFAVPEVLVNLVFLTCRLSGIHRIYVCIKGPRNRHYSTTNSHFQPCKAKTSW